MHIEYRKILTVLAPCGLNCLKCMGNVEGDIKKHSRILRELLGNFDAYAERFSFFMPVFKHYPSFKTMLEHFGSGTCRGCRQGDCKYPNCGVASCYKEKGVDFCFQCDDFPCDRTGFDPDLRARWISINRRMKDIGVEKYYHETKDVPRYR